MGRVIRRRKLWEDRSVNWQGRRKDEGKKICFHQGSEGSHRKKSAIYFLTEE